MSTLERNGLTPFRLTDLPETIRQRGKDVALRAEDNVMERVRIGIAAERPSDRIYWVPTHAYERVMRRRPPRKRKR